MSTIDDELKAVLEGELKELKPYLAILDAIGKAHTMCQAVDVSKASSFTMHIVQVQSYLALAHSSMAIALSHYELEPEDES
jgi:hypothetical protein